MFKLSLGCCLALAVLAFPFQFTHAIEYDVVTGKDGTTENAFNWKAEDPNRHPEGYTRLSFKDKPYGFESIEVSGQPGKSNQDPSVVILKISKTSGKPIEKTFSFDPQLDQKSKLGEKSEKLNELMDSLDQAFESSGIPLSELKEIKRAVLSPPLKFTELPTEIQTAIYSNMTPAVRANCGATSKKQNQLHKTNPHRNVLGQGWTLEDDKKAAFFHGGKQETSELTKFLEDELKRLVDIDAPIEKMIAGQSKAMKDELLALLSEQIKEVVAENGFVRTNLNTLLEQRLDSVAKSYFEKIKKDNPKSDDAELLAGWWEKLDKSTLNPFANAPTRKVIFKKVADLYPKLTPADRKVFLNEFNLRVGQNVPGIRTLLILKSFAKNSPEMFKSVLEVYKDSNGKLDINSVNVDLTHRSEEALAYFGEDHPSFKNENSFSILIKAGSPKVLKQILDTGIKIPFAGQSSLAEAAAAQPNLESFQVIVSHLKKEGILNEKKIGEALLRGLSKSGRVDYLKLLQKEGFPVQPDQNKFQYNLLDLAAESGNSKLVQYVLGNPNDPDEAKRGLGYQVEKPNALFTPLMSAAIGGNVQVIKMFLDHGADLTRQGHGGGSPLSFAIEQGHLDVVKYLVNELKNRKISVDKAISKNKNMKKADYNAQLTLMAIIQGKVDGNPKKKKEYQEIFNFLGWKWPTEIEERLGGI